MACDPVFFLASGKADWRSGQATDPGPSPELGKADWRSGQATDPGPSPELGKADTRSGEGPGSIACSTRHLSKFSAEPENLHGVRSAHRIRRRVRHESRLPFRRIGVPPSVIVAAPGRLHAPCGFSGPGENPLMARAHQRAVQCLSPSACLPFQARGQTLDRPPGPSPASSRNGGRSIRCACVASAPTATAGTALRRATPHRPAVRPSRRLRRSRTAAGN